MLKLLSPTLIAMLVQAIPAIIGRIFLATGAGFVTYKGLSLAIDTVKEDVISQMTGAGGQILSLVGYLWFDKAITLIFSCIAFALTIKTANGALKKLVFK